MGISQTKRNSWNNNMNRNRVTLVLLGICALYQVAHGIPVPSLNPEDYENSRKPAPDPFLASASKVPLINPEDIENSHKPAPEPFLLTDSNSRGRREPLLNPEDFE